MQEYGLINLNARLYNPFIGRFLTPDPILNTTGSLFDFNPYVYGKNCPTYYVDPNGKFAVTSLIAQMYFGYLINSINTGNWGFKSVCQGLLDGVSGLMGAIGTKIATANTVWGGIFAGAISGSLIGGLTSVGKDYINGDYKSLNDSFYPGAIRGAFFGAISGGEAAYEKAKAGGWNPFSGKIKEKVLFDQTSLYEYINNSSLFLSQGPNEGHCYYYSTLNADAIISDSESHSAFVTSLCNKYVQEAFGNPEMILSTNEPYMGRELKHLSLKYQNHLSNFQFAEYVNHNMASFIVGYNVNNTYHYATAATMILNINKSMFGNKLTASLNSAFYVKFQIF